MKSLIVLLAVALTVTANVDSKKKETTFWLTVAPDGRSMLVKAAYGQDGKLADCEAVETSNVEQPKSDSKKTSSENVDDASMDDTLDVEREEQTCRQFAEAHDSLQSIVAAEHHQKQMAQEHFRGKRSMLIWPGTNWCGKGSKAEFAGSYGEQHEADKCCQKHDQCPYLIEGFSTRFNLFNYRMHTLSHCDCDIQFMDCLKAANTSTATMVAKVYFNVVNTECFDLKLQKTCVRRSWWGSCEKYATKWTATVRTLGNFPVA